MPCQEVVPACFAWISGSPEPPEPEKFVAVRNHAYPWVKPEPHTGMWLSIEQDSNICSWMDWCIVEAEWIPTLKDPYHVWRAYLLPGSRICTIGSNLDLQLLLMGYEDTRPGILPGMGFLEQRLDYEKLANHYDGIYLTEGGQWDTRLTEPNLYGWDCASLLVLNWCWQHLDYWGSWSMGSLATREEALRWARGASRSTRRGTRSYFRRGAVSTNAPSWIR